MSLKDKAERIRSLARVAEERSGDTDLRDRTLRSLMDLKQELDQVRTVIQTGDSLADEGICDPPDRSLLRSGADKLKQRVDSSGRPSPQAIQGALRTLKSQREAQERQIREAWINWSSEMITKLPTVGLLWSSDAERDETLGNRKTLSDYSKQAPNPNITAVFRRYYDRTLELLTQASLAAGSDPVLSSALLRLDVQPSPSLADFTDAELSALRSDQTLARSVMIVRRRG